MRYYSMLVFALLYLSRMGQTLFSYLVGKGLHRGLSFRHCSPPTEGTLRSGQRKLDHTLERNSPSRQKQSIILHEGSTRFELILGVHVCKYNKTECPKELLNCVYSTSAGIFFSKIFRVIYLTSKCLLFHPIVHPIFTETFICVRRSFT